MQRYQITYGEYHGRKFNGKPDPDVNRIVDVETGKSYIANICVCIGESTGCWKCKHLDFHEEYYTEPSGSGYICSFREVVGEFKTFPCNRKLKCFVLKK